MICCAPVSRTADAVLGPFVLEPRANCLKDELGCWLDNEVGEELDGQLVLTSALNEEVLAAFASCLVTMRQHVGV